MRTPEIDEAKRIAEAFVENRPDWDMGKLGRPPHPRFSRGARRGVGMSLVDITPLDSEFRRTLRICDNCGRKHEIGGKATVEAEVSHRCRCGYMEMVPIGPVRRHLRIVADDSAGEREAE